MRAIYELRESLDDIFEMKDNMMAINADFIRKVVKDAYCHLGYYRQAKETVHKQKKTIRIYKNRTKTLEEQLETTRHQLEQATQERDAWKLRAEAAERDMGYMIPCKVCKHAPVGEAPECHTCTASMLNDWRRSNYAWRGPCAENGGTT